MLAKSFFVVRTNIGALRTCAKLKSLQICATPRADLSVSKDFRVSKALKDARLN